MIEFHNIEAAALRKKQDVKSVLNWARACVPFPSDCHAAILKAQGELEAALAMIEEADAIARDLGWHRIYDRTAIALSKLDGDKK